MKRKRGVRSLLFLAAAVGLLLVGCAEEAPGPQFAGGPVPTRMATEVVTVATPIPPLATPMVPATPVSMRDLLSARGAAPAVFVASRNAIWRISSTGEAERLFAAKPGTDVLAIDSAPNAERVAALLRVNGTAAPFEIAFVDASGGEAARIALPASSPATPQATPGVSANSIDWSPQGDRILILLDGTALFQMATTGSAEPTRIEVPDRDYRALLPMWSPTGQAIAFIAASDGGRGRSLRILDVQDGTVSDAVQPQDGRFVVEYAWMPDGLSLLFTEGGEPGGVVSGIDLWSIHANGTGRKLVASAGSVAPVARISNVRPSPDGRSVAYAVLIPGEAGPQVDSVWVREIASGAGFRIATPSVASVDDIWWTDRGLVLAVTTSAANGRPALKALLLVTGDGRVNALWAAPVAGTGAAAATPMATPAGG